jgi:hypothetical protein
MPETIGTRRTGVDLLRLRFFVSELEMSGGENHNHATRVVVERRFFVNLH